MVREYVALCSIFRNRPLIPRVDGVSQGQPVIPRRRTTTTWQRNALSVFSKQPNAPKEIPDQTRGQTKSQRMEILMDRVPKEYRTQVGQLVLLWRCKIEEQNDTIVLTHVAVCPSYIPFDLFD
jgi:hypothetical protein